MVPGTHHWKCPRANVEDRGVGCMQHAAAVMEGAGVYLLQGTEMGIRLCVEAVQYSVVYLPLYRYPVSLFKTVF